MASIIGAGGVRRRALTTSRSAFVHRSASCANSLPPCGRRIHEIRDEPAPGQLVLRELRQRFPGVIFVFADDEDDARPAIALEVERLAPQRHPRW